ncbi:MAG: FadR family transcriptional regulator [Bacteroidales bacterium]|nr:FadR family transcriptional regulator [Bacteroidales bacterium]
MAENIVIENFKEISITKPADIIISQIRELIISKQLKPGDKLPSERQLSEKLNIGRTYVRDAIKKLEFYGILKTNPQSGTYVAGIGLTALEGLITNLLQIEKPDFASLVETRVILEIQSARLAAERRTDANLFDIENSLNNYYKKISNHEAAVDEDMMFHLRIAEASQNRVLKSLMLIIIPDILTSYNKYKVCSDETDLNRYNEHMEVFEQIIAKNADAASEKMRNHLRDILQLGKLIN